MLEKAILGLVCSIALPSDVSSEKQEYRIAYPPQNPTQLQECILDKENWITLIRGYNNQTTFNKRQENNLPKFKNNKKPTSRYFRHR